MASNTPLQDAAAVIRNETADRQNTAKRVGNLFRDIAKALEGTDTADGLTAKVDKLITDTTTLDGRITTTNNSLTALRSEVARTKTETIGGKACTTTYYSGSHLLDLGTVPSAAAAEQFCAKSRIAGDRAISIIRYRFTDTTVGQKSALLLQFHLGNHLTYQYLFQDNCVRVRGVSGATGSGDGGRAYAWELAMPNGLTYDTNTHQLKLHDYWGNNVGPIITFSDIANLSTSLSTETRARSNADTLLGNRITTLEAKKGIITMLPFGGVITGKTIKTSASAQIANQPQFIYYATDQHIFCAAHDGNPTNLCAHWVSGGTDYDEEKYQATSGDTITPIAGQVYYTTDGSHPYLLLPNGDMVAIGR